MCALHRSGAFGRDGKQDKKESLPKVIGTSGRLRVDFAFCDTTNAIGIVP